MDNVEYCYDGKFEGNILIVRQTGCEKTTLIQNIAKNDLFGELKEIFWISKISLPTERKENIKSCFKKHVDFKYPQNLNDFDMELDFFQRKREDNNCNENIVMGEDNIFSNLIATVDVSGLADKFDNLANFSTISRKFNFTCVYVFHIIYPIRSNWHIILSQTKYLTFFLALYKLHQ